MGRGYDISTTSLISVRMDNAWAVRREERREREKGRNGARVGSGDISAGVDVSSVGIPAQRVNDVVQFVRSFIDGFRLSAWRCV